MRTFFLRCTLALALLAAVLPSGAALLARPAAAAQSAPVWGSKPLLGYFLLTGGLAETLRQETGLSDDQFQALQALAEQETSRLQALDEASQVLLQDASLSLQEKRQRVAESGYNDQVAGILSASQAGVEALLGKDDYAKFVQWIEARWALERKLHGAAAAPNAAARTFRIRATRYDANGAYTVALPDKCLKLSNGGSHVCDSAGYAVGQDYSVRIQYGSKSVRVKVGESGPWNVDDNFWSGLGDPQPRRLFTDLPIGIPEAQTAFFDDYNNGKDQFGRTVTSPVAIDIARDVIDDLGLSDNPNVWVDVTFLWTDGWGDGSAEAVTLKTPSVLKPPYAGDMCGSAWHKIDGFEGSPAYLTLNTDSNQSSTNSADWVPNLPAAGEYKVEAFIPDHPPVQWECPTKDIPRDTAGARYAITHAGGKTNVTINQGPISNLWVDLGTYSFQAGRNGSVRLTDVTGEDKYTRTVSFSGMRFILQEPQTPTPTPSPTPRPLDPALSVPSARVVPSATFTVPLAGLNLVSPGLGAASLELRYDPAVLAVMGCQANPAGSFATGTCDAYFDRDNVAPDAVRVDVSSPGGAVNRALLANISFRAVGPPGSFSRLQIVPASLQAPNGSSLTLKVFDGIACVAGCQNIAYLPFIYQSLVPGQ